MCAGNVSKDPKYTSYSLLKNSALRHFYGYTIYNAVCYKEGKDIDSILQLRLH